MLTDSDLRYVVAHTEPGSMLHDMAVELDKLRFLNQLRSHALFEKVEKMIHTYEREGSLTERTRS